MFTIKMDPGIVAKSFQEEDLVYISPDKLLPLSRFTGGGGGGGGGGRGRGGGRGKLLVLLFSRDVVPYPKSSHILISFI